jgi:hypothetical protein
LYFTDQEAKDEAISVTLGNVHDLMVENVRRREADTAYFWASEWLHFLAFASSNSGMTISANEHLKCIQAELKETLLRFLIQELHPSDVSLFLQGYDLVEVLDREMTKYRTSALLYRYGRSNSCSVPELETSKRLLKKLIGLICVEARLSQVVEDSHYHFSMYFREGGNQKENDEIFGVDDECPALDRFAQALKEKTVDCSIYCLLRLAAQHQVESGWKMLTRYSTKNREGKKALLKVRELWEGAETNVEQRQKLIIFAVMMVLLFAMKPGEMRVRPISVEDEGEAKIPRESWKERLEQDGGTTFQLFDIVLPEDEFQIPGWLPESEGWREDRMWNDSNKKRRRVL